MWRLSKETNFLHQVELQCLYHINSLHFKDVPQRNSHNTNVSMFKSVTDVNIY